MENPAQQSYQLFIGGKWVDASDGATLDVYCPANGEKLSTIADASKEDVDAAVDAAWKAFESWSKTDKAERAIILNKVDVMSAFTFDKTLFDEHIARLNPTAPSFAIAATKGDGVDEWAGWLSEQIEAAK